MMSDPVPPAPAAPLQMGQDDLIRMNGVLRHRLRNFASGIKSAVSLIAKDSEAQLSPEIREYFPLIINECNVLTDLTGRLNLVFEGNSERGADEAVTPLLERVMDRIRTAMPTAAISVESVGKPGDSVVSASGSIAIALNELLVNAAEASGRKQVVLNVVRDDKRVQFVVTDSGRGVPAADLEKIFLPFYTTKSRHLGIGLTIARRLVADAGGVLAAEQDKAGGLRVVVDVPVRI